jgi:hypothetical protein
MTIRFFFWGFQKDYIYQPQLHNSIQKINDNITEATVATKQHVLKDDSSPLCLHFHNNNCIKAKHIIFKGQKELNVSAS